MIAPSMVLLQLGIAAALTHMPGGTAPSMCSLSNPDGSEVSYTVDRTREMVADAAVIVWVAGAREVTAADTTPRALSYEAPSNSVKFDVKAVLKGDSVPHVIFLRGSVTDSDDFNRRSVPYIFVRPAGARGSCFADTYRRGGQFLLLLRRDGPDGLTPYWFPLMPTNEQIRGADDPWLKWVRDEIARHPAR